MKRHTVRSIEYWFTNQYTVSVRTYVRNYTTAKIREMGASRTVGLYCKKRTGNGNSPTSTVLKWPFQNSREVTWPVYSAEMTFQHCRSRKFFQFYRISQRKAFLSMATLLMQVLENGIFSIFWVSTVTQPNQFHTPNIVPPAPFQAKMPIGSTLE